MNPYTLCDCVVYIHRDSKTPVIEKPMFWAILEIPVIEEYPISAWLVQYP